MIRMAMTFPSSIFSKRGLVAGVRRTLLDLLFFPLWRLVFLLVGRQHRRIGRVSFFVWANTQEPSWNAQVAACLGGLEHLVTVPKVAEYWSSVESNIKAVLIMSSGEDRLDSTFRRVFLRMSGPPGLSAGDLLDRLVLHAATIQHVREQGGRLRDATDFSRGRSDEIRALLRESSSDGGRH
jgi:hypothetical protein